MCASSSRVRAMLRNLALALSLSGLSGAMHAAPLCDAPANLIPNAGFEEGVWALGARPTGWSFDSYAKTALGTWDNTVSRSGLYSVRIDASNPDDAYWMQAVPVPTGTPVYIEGWIRSEDVRVADPLGSPGATISALGRWDQTAPTYGATPWHKLGMSFFTDSGSLVAAPRLGFWSGLATGRAWYDDLRLVPRVADTPHPRWRILLLIYDQTDAILVVDGVQRHVVGASSPYELDQTAEQARLFVERDIPALSSGNVMPALTIRHARTPMNSLSPIGGGYWPAPGDTLSELDPGFDSVIVVWDPRVKDVDTGAEYWIGYGAGLSLARGLGQTYVTMSVEYAGVNGNRNVYKHEWGHSILSYHEALQVTPQPTVTNHAVESQYVNCKTGESYVWVDETNDNPIPNSIYNNNTGFTHDYYSGTVALAQDPTRCIGIGAQAWAWGGSATHPGSEPAFTAVERVQALMAQIDALQLALMLDTSSAATLRDDLLRAQRRLKASHERLAGTSLKVFVSHVDALARGGALLPQAAELLKVGADSASGCIGPVFSGRAAGQRR